MNYTRLYTPLTAGGAIMVNGLCVLFDNNGELWSPEKLAADFGIRHRGRELAEFVMRNLGYVVAERTFGDFVKVSYLADSVSPIALTGLIMWLYDQPDRSVVIYDSFGHRNGRLYRSRASAADAIGATIELIGRSLTFACSETALETSIFGTRWRAATEVILTPELSSGTRARILDAMFDGSYTIATRYSPDQDFQLLEVGRTLKDHFAPNVVGQTYRDMHDSDYGNWIADDVRANLRHQRPLAQEITAPIKWPRQPHRTQYKYTRLLIVCDRSDRQLLFTASRIHSDGLGQIGQMAG